MARIPINPGEHLAEKLKEFRISAGELARTVQLLSRSSLCLEREVYMVEKLSEDDYKTLEDYILAVLRRFDDEQCTSSDASGEIMHPLTAWDNGDQQEFVPYMKMMMEKWQRGEDDDA